MADENNVVRRLMDGVTFGGAIDTADLPPVPTSHPIPEPVEVATVGRRIIIFLAHVWGNVRELIGIATLSGWVIVGWVLQIFTDTSPVLAQLYFTDSTKAEFQPFNPYA